MILELDAIERRRIERLEEQLVNAVSLTMRNNDMTIDIFNFISE